MTIRQFITVVLLAMTPLFATAQIDEGDLGHGQTEGTAEDDVDHERRDQGDEQALEPAFGGKICGQKRDL